MSPGTNATSIADRCSGRRDGSLPGAKAVVSMLALAPRSPWASRPTRTRRRGRSMAWCRRHRSSAVTSSAWARAVGTLRSMLSWASVDPTKAPDDYNWSVFDTIVGEAAQRRHRAAVRVRQPGVGREGPERRSCTGARCATSPRARRRRSTPGVGSWATPSTATGAAVSSGPRTRCEEADPRLADLERAELEELFTPKPSTKSYAKLLASASKAIRSADRRADVVLGGMAELAGSKKAVPGPEYLDKFYRRSGVERDFDGIAVHPTGRR